MPYIPIKNLSRRGEKVAPFLSVQNITGMVVVAGPIWLLTLAAPDLLRFGLVVSAALLGYLVTLDLRGMSLAERLLWRARGQIRSAVRGRTIAPADLPGMASTQVHILATPRDGPFQMHQSAPLPAPRAHATVAKLASSAPGLAAPHASTASAERAETPDTPAELATA